ncbi:MAG: glycosyltransferase [Rhizomicrobium sp.]
MAEVPCVTVAIPTFKRPRGLARLLEALARLETDATVTVLVADNDAESHEGADLCAAVRAKGYRWPLRATIVAQRGIAQARNALVEAALGDAHMDYLAMLDDDEWPEPHWLSALLAEQARSGAGVLQGSILFDFEDPPKAWARRVRRPVGHPSRQRPGRDAARRRQPPDDRAALDSLPGAKFDPAFALTGGEDRDFFLRLKQAGIRFAWSDEGVAHTFIPASRSSLTWALARAYSIGNSDMRVFLKYGPSVRARLAELGKIAAALLLSPVLFVILAFDANRRADALRRMFRAAGKVTALFGRQYNEYSVIHGE